jgi:hypothetical protein
MDFVIKIFFQKGHKMNRILLTALASVALLSSQSLATSHPVEHPAQPHAHHHDHYAHHHHHKKGEKTREEMTKEFEEQVGTVKNAGASLPADVKAEFDYNLEIAGVEISALKNANIKDHKKHALSCHRHIANAEQILKKHEHFIAREKKMEEKKAKAAERKARADQRKAQAEERKAKRDAEKAARQHNKEHKQAHVKASGQDNGRIEGVDTTPPGSEAAKPAS